ncbi:AbrB/MazE/SpoVT family DNA-binding domain-containing protein [Candidatus Woesearchaeota archaeon]|nr:AbrB/MazE/SpoVT family DNA-binding domain-containing protein [Candidatus Woesearchaeota archaeon]
MESRKIQLVGNRSYSVSLPKRWVLANNLKEKEVVFIDINNNDELIIKKADTENRKKESISVNLEEIDNIAEFLMICYVKNIDNIKILTKKPEYEKIKSIRNVLKYLEGYDIISENKNKIKISFLFNTININLKKILIRMNYLLKLELASIENKDMESLEETETSIDKLYHLSKRILFSCIRNKKLRQENDIKHDEDIFFYKDIFKKLENIGDNIVKLKNQDLSKKETKELNKFLELLSYLLVKKQNTAQIKDSLSKIKFKSNDDYTDRILGRLNELGIDIIQNSVSIKFNETYFS